jgi:O-antigen/teichoic acid export membrane protein
LVNDTRDISNRSVSAALWGVAGMASRVLLQVGSQIALARILGPEQFGLFALALVVVAFSSFFADVGLAYGLIQRRSLSDDDVRFVFTWQIVLGAAATMLLLAAAPIVSEFYGDDRLGPVLAWLSISCLINSLGATSNALLRRAMDFRSIHLAAVSSYAIGFFGLGIPMALAGYGVGALIAAYLVQTALAAAITYVRSAHPLRPLFLHPDARGIMGFGLTVLATNLINWLMTSADRLVVGRTMSITAAGLYSTIHNFITAPTVQALSVLQGVLYSASANVQRSRRRLRKGFCTMFGAVGLFVTPVFFAVAAVSDTFVAAVYGAKWAGGGVVLAPLALAMPALLLMGMAVPALWATGNTRSEFQLQIPIAVLWIVVLLLVAPTGSLAALSWTVCTLYYVRAAIIIAATCRALRLPARAVPGLLGAGAAVTTTVTAAAWLVDRSATAWVPDVHSRMVIVIAACAITMAGALRLFRPLVRPEIVELVDRIVDRLPVALRQAARILLPT